LSVAELGAKKFLGIKDSWWRRRESNPAPGSELMVVGRAFSGQFWRATRRSRRFLGSILAQNRRGTMVSMSPRSL
jgi:hypothetical protein